MTDTDFTFLDDPDTVVETPAAEDTPPGDELSGRRTRKKRSDAGQPRGGAPRAGRKTNSRKLSENLLEPWALIAKGLSPKSPTAAAVMIQRGEVTCAALVAIAEKHPKMLKALENIGKIGPATILIQTGAEIFLALMMDMGNIPVEHPMAYGLGITQLYYEVHPYMPEEQPEHERPTEPVRPAPAQDGFITSSDPRHPMYSFAAGNLFGGTGAA